eukprot:50103-Prorocentrum_lima.AAC.1
MHACIPSLPTWRRGGKRRCRRIAQQLDQLPLLDGARWYLETGVLAGRGSATTLTRGRNNYTL